MALMGPSGAGKTTLLNALAGMAPYAETSADMVLLKGMPFKKEHLGYVPQVRILTRTLVVPNRLPKYPLCRERSAQSLAFAPSIHPRA